MIEPYLGYALMSHGGKLDNYGTKLDVPTKKDKGSLFGARIGWGQGNFGVALDYMKAGMDGKSGEDKTTGDITALGITAMASLLFVRGWIGYMPSVKYDYDGGENLFKGSEKGSGFKVGVGFTPIPWVSINVEYVSYTFDKADYRDFQGTSRTTSGPMFGVSIPIVF